ncbi:MAG: hypothetical protein M1824_003410 [Vezdaea acicularis]|nr:MAG: hypothetical protein M1824_003410 [Vezdaea acicularis]
MAKDATAQPPSQPHPSALPKPTTDATPLTEPVPIVPAPPLSTYLATSPTTIISALKLIADSIAQQRQLASRALIFHPLSLSLFIGLLGFLTSIMYDGTNASLPLIFTTFAGICMACLVAVRGATAGYINAAEQLNLGFLKPEGGSIGGEADDILVTTYGDLVIGVLILRFPPGSGAASSSAASSSTAAGGSARKGAKKSQQPASTSTPKDEDKTSAPKTVLVRAWTVKMRYRGTGVGRALLEEGVKLARERCRSDVKVVFDKEHANCKKLLPGLFMAGFSGREERARKSLAKVVGGESKGERVGREPAPPPVEEGGRSEGVE